MVRPVEVIRREIESLTEATVTLAAEFRRLYSGYLNSLGVAVQRQAVMATYHLCTQVYPEGFLALSVSQREKLQRDVRQLGRSAQTQLGQLLESAPNATAPVDPRALSQLSSLPGDPDLALRFLPGEVAKAIDNFGPDHPAPDHPDPGNSDSGNPDLDHPDSDHPDPEQSRPSDDDAEANSQEDTDQDQADSDAEDSDEEDAEEMPLPSLLKSMVMAALAEEMGETFGAPLFTGDDMTPTRLAKQHIFLEQQIRDILQHLSKQVNQRLQEAQVIPNLPEAVLDAASETEMGPMRGRAVPNVLSVLVAMAGNMDDPLDEDASDRDRLEDENDSEDEDEDDPREGLMTHLAAVNLRLADVEFGDVQASMGRSKLRTALGHLRKVGKQYQKVLREMSIAEAEQAWRTVWYDES
jgi:hypothetical protein